MLILILSLFPFSMVYASNAGDWDSSFNGQGYITSAGISGDYYSSSLNFELQDDGKIIAVGQDVDASSNYLASVIRLSSGGELDINFDDDGIYYYQHNSSGNTFLDNVIQLDNGSFLMQMGDVPAGDRYLMNTDTDMNLTTAFSGGFYDLAGDGVNTIVKQTDGKPVVVKGDNDLLRFNADLSTDTAFGSNGLLSLSDAGFSGHAFIGLIESDNYLFVALFDLSNSDNLILRINKTDGSLDTDFASGAGEVRLDHSSYSDIAKAMTLTTNDQLVLHLGDNSLTAYDLNGDINNSFGSNGVMALGIDYSNAHLLANADGRIVVVGKAGTDFTIAMVTSAGTLDSSFNDTGSKVIETGANNYIINEASLDSDNNIVFIGEYRAADGEAYQHWAGRILNDLDSDGDGTTDDDDLFPNDASEQFDTDGDGIGNNADTNDAGDYDVSFNGQGWLTSTGLSSSQSSYLYDIFIQQDGSIFSVGTDTDANGTQHGGALRVTADGAMDTSFNGDGLGHYQHTVDNNNSFLSTVRAADGSYLVAGKDWDAGQFYIANFDSHFSLTSAFTDGVFTSSGYRSDYLLRQSDDKVVAFIQGKNSSNWGVQRFNSDLTNDADFGDNGLVDLSTAGFDGYNTWGIAESGSYLYFGIHQNDQNSDESYLVRVSKTDGSIDTSFGSNGKFSIDTDNTNSLKAMLVTSDNQLLIINASEQVYAFNEDGSAVSSFGDNGVLQLTIDFSRFGMLGSPAGHIFVIGTDRDDYDLHIYRLTADGQLDSDFNGNGYRTHSSSSNRYELGRAQLDNDGNLVVGLYERNDSSTGKYQLRVARFLNDLDSDDDGSSDFADAFPNDASETTDSDGDSVGDNSDAFPNDASEITDTDGDGVGDNSDVFPNDASEATDSDGVGDNSDAFPNDTSETTDSDSDGVGDNSDAFPNDASETSDSDGDGVGDNSDAFPNDASEAYDIDGDGIGDNADTDDAGDFDLSFNAQGWTAFSTHIDEDYTQLEDVTVMDDGKILTAGYNELYNDIYDGYFGSVALLNNDGSFDSDFSGNGQLLYDFTGCINGGCDSEFFAVNQASDGSLLVAGGDMVTDEAKLVNFDTYGIESAAFDAGIFTTTGKSFKIIHRQSDGKVVALFSGFIGTGGTGFALARFQNDLSLDTDFGDSGILDLTLSGETSYGTFGLVETTDYLFVGITQSSNRHLFRINKDLGSVDTNYGDDGALSLSFLNDTSLYSMAKNADNEIVLASTTGKVYVIDQEGASVLTFGDNGSVDLSSNFNKVDLLATSDGRIVFVGSAFTRSHNYVTLMRLNANGELDSTFDHDGMVVIASNTDGFFARAATLDNNNNIVLAGYTSVSGSDAQGWVARILNDIDTDDDGIFDKVDTDDDNDSVADSDDAFPLDDSESVDTDGDGIGNNADTDDDNDGVPDDEDAFPLDDTESEDSDGDGVGDNADDSLYPPAGELNFESTDYVVDENAGSVVITVNRANGVYGKLSVDYALQDAEATATVDYEFATGTLTFVNGEVSKTITLNIIDDNEYEGDESFTISLNNLSQNDVDEGSIGSVSVATILINEDDAVPSAGEIALEFDTELVIENDGSFLISIVRVDGSFGEISISYSTSDDTAITGNDYSAVSGSLVFADGETAKTISIDVINDEAYESDETFTVQLSNLVGDGTLGTSLSTVTILDDEPLPDAGVLEIESATYYVNENAGSLSLNIIRTGGDFGEVSVDFSSSDSTAIADEDYESTLQSLTFADGEIVKTVTVNTTDDSVYEGDETFNVTLSSVVGSELGNQSTSTVTIVEDDEVPLAGVIQFSGASYSVDENAGSVLLTITRTNGSSGDVSVELTTQDGTASSNEKYQTFIDVLTFLDGETSQTVSIEIYDDAVYQGNETFNVVLFNLVGDASLGNPSTATVTIVEDEPVPVAGVLQFSGDSYSVNEGDSSVTITVQRTDGSYGDVSVDYSIVDGSAVNGNDYLSIDATLYFADGEMSQTIVIDVMDDNVDENTETLTVALTNPINITSGSIQSATVSIEDNDDAPVVEEPPTNNGGGGSVNLWLLFGVVLLVVKRKQ